MINDERRLVAWLQDGPERGPATGLARALAATRDVPQRPTLVARITSSMPDVAAPPRRIGAMTLHGEGTWVIALALLALLAILGVLVVGREIAHPRNLLAYCADAHPYVVAVDGGTPHQVLDDVACGLQWSPDGSWLMAWSWDSGDIWIVRGDGSDARVIASGREARWSPDGERIAFIRTIDGVERTVIHDVASGREEVVDAPGALAQAALLGWVDVGHVLVRECTSCESTRTSDARFRILPGDQPVAIDEPTLQWATMSPDGRRLAWSQCLSEAMADCGLRVTEIATGATTEIVAPPLVAYDPMTWRQSGDAVVYPEADGPDAREHLAVTRLDGSRIPVALRSDERFMGGAYAPGDDRLAVVLTDDLTQSLAILEPGGELRPIASARSIETPVWQPPATPSSRVPEPHAVAANPCIGARPAGDTTLVEVDDGAGCVRLYASGDGGRYMIDFDAGDSLGDLAWMGGGDPTTDLLAMNAARILPLGEREACPDPGRQLWCLVTSGGEVVRLTLRDGWSPDRPLELDFVVIGSVATPRPLGASVPPSAPLPGAPQPAASLAPVAATLPPMPSCDRPSVPDGAVAGGCVAVPQTWTFSLDSGSIVHGPADLWFEAATEDELYLTRSFDWPGPMTALRLVEAGGRQECVDALASPDPTPVEWPTPDAPADVNAQPHGIPFTSLAGAAACATSLGGHVFEVRLRGMAGDVTVDGLTLSLAEFTWIDWGDR